MKAAKPKRVEYRKMPEPIAGATLEEIAATILNAPPKKRWLRSRRLRGMKARARRRPA